MFTEENNTKPQCFGRPWPICWILMVEKLIAMPRLEKHVTFGLPDFGVFSLEIQPENPK